MDLPAELAACIAEANADDGVHVIVLSGAGRAFCAGYDLKAFAETEGPESLTQDMPWDSMKDYAFMMRNTELFMSVWRSYRPVICKVHGFTLAGGSDIAMCADLIVMGEEAEIGYMPARVWGCPTTAMWVYRLGAEGAKRTLFTGDKIKGVEAQRIGLVHKSVPDDVLDSEVESLAERICGVPVNQLMMQKLMINQAIDAMGLSQTQMFATLFDGITRHSPKASTSKSAPRMSAGNRPSANAIWAPMTGPPTGRSMRRNNRPSGLSRSKRKGSVYELYAWTCDGGCEASPG